MSTADLPTGAALIAAERKRQVEYEGYTAVHDSEHDRDDLACAAVCYAIPAQRRFACPPDLWPWGMGYWKPTPDDRVRELVKAGALIAAEIDRLHATAVTP